MAVNINIPSQVKTFANLAAFPATGSLKTIFIAEDTNKTYRWTGSVYVEISGADFSGYVPTSRTLTINGTTQDLSANRTFTVPTDLTIGTTPIASGTNGRVLFQGTGNVLQQSSSLSFDSATNLLTSSGSILVGSSLISASAYPLQVVGGAGGSALFSNTTRTQALNINLTTANETRIYTDYFLTGIDQKLILGTFANRANQLVLNTTGNIGINTTTDAGFRLDVNGTARVQDNLLLTNGIIATSTATTRLQGSLNYFSHNRIASSGVHGYQIATFGTVTSFWRWDSGTYDIELGSPSGALSQNFKLFTAGSERMRLSAGGNILINTTTDAGFRLDVNGTARVQDKLTIVKTENNTFDGVSIQNLSSGYTTVFRAKDNSTGVCEFGLGGTASPFPNEAFFYTNKQVLSFYANALERMRIASNGNILIGTTTNGASKLRVVGLPTSSAGLSAGDVWNDGGTLKIV